uniref:Reverse transcriptase domain-containing protein n=1 Tax=Knipowitschia caucasica TaxID=637954 RepID=A0AAV2JTI1_KNICA
MTGHASKCRIGREVKQDGGDFACALCAKHLKTQRGLSQHLRLAHLGAYLEMGRKSKDPLLLRPPGPGLSGILERLNTPLVDVPRVNELVQVMRANWGPPGQTTRVGINREARNLVIKFRRKIGLTKITGLRRSRNALRLPRNVKEAYRLTQELWQRDPHKAAQLILDGAPPNCVLTRATIEETYKRIWCGRDRYKSLAGFGKLPVTNNKEFHPAVTGLEVVRTIKGMAKRSCPGPDGLQRSQLLCDRKGLKLAKLFNDWLRAGMIPKVFKASKTTLIPKSRCSENLTVIDGLITLAKKERRELAVVFIDLAKAFDTVSHRLIGETLTRRGVDQLVVKVIMDGYRGCTSSIRTCEGPTKEIPIKLGVKQGDPLSPLLFNLALDPLLYALDDGRAGFEFGEDAAIAEMAFADDLVLVSGSWEGMRSNLAVLDAFCDRVGLAVNPDKCVAFHIGHQGRKGILNACPTWTINGQPVRLLNGQEQAKYLGVEIHPWKGVCCPPLSPKLESGLVKIDKAGIKPHQRLVVLRSYLLPKFLYACDHSGLSRGSLRALDAKVKVAVKGWLHLDRSTTDGLLYARFKDGGLSIPRLERQVPIMKLNRLLRMIHSECPITHEISSLLNLEAKVRELYLELTGIVAPEDLGDVVAQKLRSSNMKVLEHNRWKLLRSQGKGVEVFANDQVSNFWLRSNTVIMRYSAVARAPNADSSCRFCQYPKETLPHIIGNCPEFKENRMSAHNKVCGRLGDLASEKGWKVLREEHVIVSGRTWVPDLIITKDGKGMVLDVTICFEQSLGTLREKAEAKQQKYEHLKPVLEKGLKLSHMAVEGFPMGARGKWHKGNYRILEEMGFSKTAMKLEARRLSKLVLVNTIRTHPNIQGRNQTLRPTHQQGLKLSKR